MKNILLIALIGLLSSCASLKKNKATTYWVNSYKTDCSGVAPMQCMLIQKGDTLNNEMWQNFYSDIEGFDYKPGYIYKLKVKEEQLDPSMVPADASSIKYTLVKVEEQNQDLTLRLNDIWLLTSVYGEEVNRNTVKRNNGIPVLEIHIAKHRILGTDGCNQFGGELKTLTNNEIAFGPIMGTKKMCSEMHISDSFNKAMYYVRKYKLEDMSLVFYDGDNKELMRFKKID